MDIYARLKQDHDLHRKLAEQLAATSGDSADRQRLWKQFRPEVEAHANAEDQTFYAALIEQPDGQEMARHSVAEHQDAADLFKKVADCEMSSSAWLQHFDKLKESLEHHMKEEEGKVFDLARRVLSDSTANELVESFETRKSAD